MLFALKIPFYKFLIQILKIVVKFMSQAKPVVFCGPGSCVQLVDTIFQMRPSKVVIVTDRIIHQLGLLDKVKNAFAQKGIEFVVFDDVDPDPTFDHCRKASEFARKHGCDCVLGFGGGSPIDVAKLVAMVVPDNREPEKFAGFNKAKKPLLPLYVIPTTAGTGSEVSMGAVISYADSHNKDLVVEAKSVPLAVALDAELMLGLPPNMTASSGLDALSHAVEAYINKAANENSDIDAKTAVRMIFNNLRTAYRDGGNLEAREAMSLAAFYAGLAFARVGTGYVHAIAHQLGRFYNTPHGTANAVTMPYVLKYSKDAAMERLADLAVVIGAGSKSEDNIVLAQKFIEEVEKLNRELDIPATASMIQEKDIPEIVKSALKEANYTYAVPKYMSPRQCKTLIYQMAG